MLDYLGQRFLSKFAYLDGLRFDVMQKTLTIWLFNKIIVMFIWLGPLVYQERLNFVDVINE